MNVGKWPPPALKVTLITVYYWKDTGAQLYYHALNLNDIHDPMGTAGTVVPGHSANFAALYDRYVVVGGRIKYQGLSYVAANNAINLIEMACSIAQDTASGVRDVAEHRKSQIDQRPTNGSIPVEFNRSWTCEEYLPGDDMYLVSATPTNSPTEILRFHIASLCHNAANYELGNYVRMEQDVIFYKPDVCTPALKSADIDEVKCEVPGDPQPPPNSFTASKTKMGRSGLR